MSMINTAWSTDVFIVCDTFQELVDMNEIFLTHKKSGSLTYGKMEYIYERGIMVEMVDGELTMSVRG